VSAETLIQNPTGSRTERESAVTLLDGSVVQIRPIRPDDAPSLIAFHDGLSEDTVRLRFFAAHPHLQSAEVERFTRVDNHDRVALVGLIDGALVAVGRYERLPETTSAEVAFVVADEYQGRGLGTVLLERLAAAARSCGLDCFVADVLPENHRMLEVFRNAGFPEKVTYDGGLARVTFSIKLCEEFQEAHQRREMNPRFVKGSDLC
jgi:RimJ/RimL family protein N-acetyltransferase